MRRSLARDCLAIGLASLAVLLYEVAITRLLSVVLWYHFAFLSISLALLGLGAPGIWLSLRAAPARALSASLLAAGVSVPASVVLITKIVARLPRTEKVDAAGFLNPGMVLTVFALLIPFLCLGTAVCLLLMRAPGRQVGRVYGADLLGATLGAALVVPLLHVVPTPWLLAGCGLLPLAAVLVLAESGRAAAGGLLVALAAAIGWGTPFELHHTKKYAEEGRIIHEKWTPTGRITVWPDVFYEDDPSAAFAWGIGERFEPRPIEQLWIEQDGSAGTPITKWTGALENLDHLLYDVTSFGYQLRRPDSVCVIGSGGGRDVLAALLAGASHVDAVELNPHILDVVSGPFGDFSGDLYGLPGVSPIASEGRSFLTRSPHRYDFIQISMVDSWAATSAGAFALSENYLYTTEALELYWERLRPGGMFSISRWMMDRHLAEGVRLVLLAQEALRKVGVQDPNRHLVVVQAKAVANLIVLKRPLDRELLTRVDAVCSARGFVRHWPPAPNTPERSLMPRVLLEGPGFMANSGLDLSAPDDDRPFFFQAVPVLGRVNLDLVERLSVNEQSVVLLRRLLLLVAIVTVALFFLPFAFSADVVPRNRWTGTGYFAAIGLAFLLVEASWIQRFILYLGHPSYATTVVLAAILLGLGLGSFTAARVSVASVLRWGPALPVLLAVVNFGLTPVFEATLGWAIAARVTVSIVALLPAGLLMGFAFPTGMVRFGDEGKPWFWAMNGAFSVLGSVSSLGLAMLAGHTAVGYVGIAVYVVAYLLLRREPQPPGEMDEVVPAEPAA